MNGYPVLLLTGAPGIGKTTLIKRLAVRLSGLSIAGFYTEEIRAGRQRVGFRLVGLRGESGVIAHVDFDLPFRVGRYHVDVAAIDHLAETTLAPEDAELYLIDEIGRMECLSQVFAHRVGQLVASGGPVIATVAKKGSGFIEEVKHRPGIDLWEVTKNNRDALVERVFAWLQHGRITP